jgi:hypothetical protein
MAGGQNLLMVLLHFAGTLLHFRMTHANTYESKSRLLVNNGKAADHGT